MSDSIYVFWFWAVEVFHAAIFVLFIHSLYRVIRYGFAPHSSLYSGYYMFIHAVYNGCPVITSQNYFAEKLGWILNDNQFLRINLDQFEMPMRVISIGLTILLFNSAYQQFKALDLDPKHWLSFWLEPKLTQEYMSQKTLKLDQVKISQNTA